MRNCCIIIEKIIKEIPTNMELIDFAQKQFQDELVLDIESTTRYPTYLLKSLLKPINEE